MTKILSILKKNGIMMMIREGTEKISMTEIKVVAEAEVEIKEEREDHNDQDQDLLQMWVTDVFAFNNYLNYEYYKVY